MLDLKPGDLCTYLDDGDTPRVLLSRVLMFLYVNPKHSDEGMFLCNDGSLDEEYFVFLRRL